jgi:hypothetical protein
MEYFRAIWYMLWQFDNFVVIWYVSPRFGILYQQKSGNPVRPEMLGKNPVCRQRESRGRPAAPRPGASGAHFKAVTQNGNKAQKKATRPVFLSFFLSFLLLLCHLTHSP